MFQGFLVGSDGGMLYLFERDGEGAARTYRKSKALLIEGQSVKIRNLAASPAEDTLLCTLENNQMYSLNLTNTEIMKVCLLTPLCLLDVYQMLSDQYQSRKGTKLHVHLKHVFFERCIACLRIVFACSWRACPQHAYQQAQDGVSSINAWYCLHQMRDFSTPLRP